MDIKDILARVDHTVLGQAATWEDIKALCDDGMKYRTASVCIPPSFVKQAAEYIKQTGRCIKPSDKEGVQAEENAQSDSSLKVCTVIGFPNGYNTTAVKCFEAEQAVLEGADEIDMVINIGWAKAGMYDEILKEIKAVKSACNGRLLKVIIETCLLTDEEKIKLCQVVSESGAEYIKTSTGFSTAGATFADVELMVKNVAPGVLVKAAGGISSIADAEKFIELGASRLGTSRIVKIVKNQAAEGNAY